jgi:hypothetical protein
MQIEQETFTLENLLGAYCDYLKSLERKSHAATWSIFKVHILEAWPEIAALPLLPRYGRPQGAVQGLCD